VHWEVDKQVNECFLVIIATLGLLGLILPFFDE
jgi:hypothetical protein